MFQMKNKGVLSTAKKLYDKDQLILGDVVIGGAALISLILQPFLHLAIFDSAILFNLVWMLSRQVNQE